MLNHNHTAIHIFVYAIELVNNYKGVNLFVLLQMRNETMVWTLFLLLIVRDNIVAVDRRESALRLLFLWKFGIYQIIVKNLQYIHQLSLMYIRIFHKKITGLIQRII